MSNKQLAQVSKWADPEYRKTQTKKIGEGIARYRAENPDWREVQYLHKKKTARTLTNDEAKQVKGLLADNCMSLSGIANLFGCSYNVIWSIRDGRTYKHVL